MNAAPVFPILRDVPRSGLVYLRDRVADYFGCNAIPATVAPVGLKYRFFVLNASPGGANRIVFIPGEFDGEGTPKSRKYGSINRETRNSASVVNPPEIANWDRPFTVSVWGAPAPGKVEDEQAAIAIVEDLLEEVVRAVQEGVASAVTWGEVLIKSPPQENGFGVELLASAILHGPFYGRTLDVVQAQPAISRTGA
jgi:hypothetical protein